MPENTYMLFFGIVVIAIFLMLILAIGGSLS